ncbi:hypothetical protein [Aquisphaera insulae]|uniref:hypothetical protein n=1 Tax=Aquisphaera insulae TaxID=2712864 RepID=UPI0013E9D157|nr:hypothetical protein [Aquisphaera insulae]
MLIRLPGVGDEIIYVETGNILLLARSLPDDKPGDAPQGAQCSVLLVGKVALRLGVPLEKAAQIINGPGNIGAELADDED